MGSLQKTIQALLLISPILGISQDPAGFLFRQQGALYNPALAGGSGSQSVSIAYRNEWQNNGRAGYQTGVLNYEESLPCSVLDYSISALWDQEGWYDTGTFH